MSAPDVCDQEAGSTKGVFTVLPVSTKELQGAGGVAVRDPKNSPFLARTTKLPTTDNQTLVHLIKSSLGTGILAMPWAFSHAGIAGGPIGLIIIGLVSTYCIHVMVRCAHELCWRHNIPALGFADLAEVAFQHGPLPVRRYSTAARYTIQTFLIVMTLSALAVWTVFVASNIQQVANEYLQSEVSLEVYILGVWLTFLCLVMVRDLRYISPFSLLSNLLALAAIAIVLSYVFVDLPSVSERPAFASWQHLPLFFSTAVFAISGHAAIMPLENEMSTPEHFLGPFRVLNTAMVFLVSLYTVVGFFGLQKYGDDVAATISLNIPSDQWLAQSANVMLALSVGLTYPLVFYCTMQFTWPGVRELLKKKWPGAANLAAEYLYRVLLVSTISGVALGIPNLGALMGLTGALFTSAVAFLFPPILECVVFWEQLGAWSHLKNLLIVVFGLTGAITGSYVSILDIIATFAPEQ